MHPSPSPSSGFLNQNGPYTAFPGLAPHYPTEWQQGSSPQPTSNSPLPVLHWTQERYVGVSAIIVYIGEIEVNQSTQKIPMVARVSIVDYRGSILLDTFVRPTNAIEDYRSAETGIHHQDLMNAPTFQDVQLRVADIVRNKIIVGHSLWSFLSVLGLSHPALDTRDLALFYPLRKKLKSRLIVSLPTLVYLYMGRLIGMEYEDSLELSRAAMDLFRCCEQVFEQTIQDGSWPCNLPPSAFSEYFT